MTTPEHDMTNQRSATRAPVGRPIKLQFDDSLDRIEGHCRNISIGGMFILVDSTRPPGSLVRFELLLEDDTAIRGLGEVVWMRPKSETSRLEGGLGLKFRFLEQRDRQRIFKLVSRHIKDRLSRREPAGPPVPSVEVAVPPDPAEDATVAASRGARPPAGGVSPPEPTFFLCAQRDGH